jgi:endonuclease YncB( thermonuclease family)
MPKLLLALLLAAASCIAVPTNSDFGHADPTTKKESKKVERLDGCSFLGGQYFDGDSFSLLTPKGETRICRLYAVDTCETDNEFAERVTEQALYFGITSEQAVELGNKAKNFTEERLKNKKFSFVTKWQTALGRSKTDRFYGEIIVGGESLACILVKNGLARIHGIIPPNDGAFVFTRAKLERLEAEAKNAGAGGWGIAKAKK